MFSKGKVLVLMVSMVFVAYAVVGGIMGTDDANVRTFKELRIFSDVLSKIQSDYVDSPEINKVLSGALQGLVDALDARCSFIPAASVVKMREHNGKYQADIGVVLAKRYAYGYVLTSLADGPGEAAGLRAGDLIERIDGTPTTELSLAEIESLLRGPDGSTASLVVIRSRSPQPVTLSVKRRMPETPSSSAKILEGGVGYLKIAALEKGAAEQVAARLRMLSSGSVSGIVLDLRGSAGWNYDEAMKTADLFLPAGKTLGSLRERGQVSREFASTDDPADTATPLVVLANAATTGAAEVLAVALKENDRAQVLGEKTAGLAAVQKDLELEDGSLLILTSQLLYTPQGEPIQNENVRKAGVQPTQKVPDDGFVANFYYQNPGLSPEEQYNQLLGEVEKVQLQKAIELLKGSLKKAA